MSDNPARLKGFVSKCLERAKTEPDPIKFLNANIAHVERMCHEAERLARAEESPPEHLVGLGLFEFAEALNDLHVEVIQRERVAA